MPTFKFHRPALSGKRPDDLVLKIRRPQDRYSCDFHSDWTVDCAQSVRFVCPCASGNLDINAVTANVGRQVGMQTPTVYFGNSNSLYPAAKKPWWQPGDRYDLFLKRTMTGHPLYELLSYAKDMPGPWRDKARKTAFYDSFTSDNVMPDLGKQAYNYGDVSSPPSCNW